MVCISQRFVPYPVSFSKPPGTLQCKPRFYNHTRYDALHRMTRIEQSGQSGGHAVAEKRIDLSYDAASQWQTITRYADLAATKLVATSDYTFDAAGRLTALTHAQGATPLAGYTWTYDAAHRVTEFTSLLDGTAEYTYDQTDQLVDADYTYQDDEAYGYDAEGNRTRRTHITSGEVTEYDWDHRNRLTRVTVKASDQGPVTKDILYGYELVFPFNQRFQPRVQLSRSSAAAPMTDQFVHPKRADAASPEADRRRELYNT